MNPDEIARLIPPEAVEAACVARYGALWAQFWVGHKDSLRADERAVLVASISAWPGAYEFRSSTGGQALSLPAAVTHEPRRCPSTPFDYGGPLTDEERQAALTKEGG